MKAKYARWWNKQYLRQLDVDLTTVELRCRFFEKPHDFEKEKELRLSAKERINEIKTLKEEGKPKIIRMNYWIIY